MKCDFHHCRSCEFIFKDPGAFVSPERERRQYEQHNNSFENAGYVAMFKDFISRCVTPYRNNIATVLEFGSGPGPVLAGLLGGEGFHVDIYDKFFAPEPLYEGKTYDLITSTEVMEHIADPLEIMAFFHSHLNASGRLALMTQFHGNNIDSFLKWWYRVDPTHISFYRPKSFKIIAEKIGFVPLYFDTKKMIVLQKCS
jgi:hypothetical protein